MMLSNMEHEKGVLLEQLCSLQHLWPNVNRALHFVGQDSKLQAYSWDHSEA